MRFSPHFISTTYHNVQCVFFPMNQLYLLSSSSSAALVAHPTVGQCHFSALHFPVRTVRQCTHLSIVLSDCLTVSFYCSLLCSGQKPPPLPVNTHSLVVGHVTDGSGYKSCCLDNEKQEQQRHQSIYLSVAMTLVVLHTKGVLLSQSECHFVDHFTTAEPAR